MTIARLFMNGRSQAVRLPAEFRFEGDAVAIRRDPVTGEVILSAIPTSWEAFRELRDALIRSAPDAFEGFMEDRRQGEQGERDGLR